MRCFRNKIISRFFRDISRPYSIFAKAARMIRLIRGEQIYFAGCFYLLSGEGYLEWNIGKM